MLQEVNAYTVKLIVLLHPVLVCVNVSVTVPADTPVTSPALVIVAIAGLLLVHVPPVLGVTFAVNPIQTEVAPPKVGAPGMAFITTFDVDNETHPYELLTVKE